MTTQKTAQQALAQLRAKAQDNRKREALNALNSATNRETAEKALKALIKSKVLS